VLGKKGVRGLEELLRHVQEILAKLVHSPGWKVVGAIFLACVQALFGDYRPALLSIFILYVTDWVLGLSYAINQHEVESNRLLRGAIKAVIYGNLLIVGAQLGKTLLGTWLLGVIDSYILLTESVSVLEKLDKWARRYGVELPFLGRLIKYLRQQRDRTPDEFAKEATTS
jgi:phage-related holin